MVSFSSSKVSILLSALLVVVGSVLFTLAPVTNVSANSLDIENVIENNLSKTVDGVYFDKVNAMNEGLSSEEATLLDELYNGVENTSNETSQGEITTMALPLVVLPLLSLLPSGAVTAIKAAALGGAAAVGGAFAIDLYNTGAYAACKNHYGKVAVLDNYCDGKGYSF